jgi:hypothetical protein
VTSVREDPPISYLRPDFSVVFPEFSGGARSNGVGAFSALDRFRFGTVSREMTGAFTRKTLYQLRFRGGYQMGLELFDVQLGLADAVAQIEKSIDGIDFIVPYFVLIIWADVTLDDFEFFRDR